MIARKSLWLRETLRIWLQYLVVGLASIPAGVFYALLLNAGIREKTALIIALPIGLGLAYLAWELVGKKVVVNEPLRQVYTHIAISASSQRYAEPVILPQTASLRFAAGITCVILPGTAIQSQLQVIPHQNLSTAAPFVYLAKYE